MKFKLLLALVGIILMPVFSQAQLIGSDVLPFGPYSSTDPNTSLYSNQHLEIMHDSLGINQFTSGDFYDTTAQRFANHGIYVYPWGHYSNDFTEPQTQYAGVDYFICQAESTTGYYNVRFKVRHGWVYQDSLWACRDSAMMLGGLTMIQKNKYAWLDPYNRLEYHPYLRIGVDTTTKADSLVTDTMLVGIFKVWQHWPQPDTLRFIDSIYVHDLPYGHDTLLALIDDRSDHDPLPYYTLTDSSNEESQRAMLFELVKPAPNCTLYVDYLKTHSQFGLQLMEQNQYAQLIKQYTGREGYRGKILGWFIKDIQYPGNVRPFAYIDSLIRDTTRVWGADSVRAASHVVPFSGSGNWNDDGYRDFVRFTCPRQMWSFLYPIWLHTGYSGYSENLQETLQKDFEFYLTIPCDSISKALEEVPGSSWMYVPQYWYCDSSDADPCFGGEQRRKPTEAELRAMTYIGLCYQPKGIMFYKYDSHPPRPPWEKFTKGIVDSIGNPRPGMYNVIKDDIIPYLKAIDSVYMGLDWQRAYAYDEEHSQNPPGGAFVSSIQAVSNTSDPNPDLGWFQVGEFTKSGANDKYIMLVNRACSQDPDTAIEAPSITAKVRFNPSTIGSDYVLITDLTDSLYKSCDTCDWVGIPKTTYSGKMPDGTIPYTISLGAGEGKLLKIVATNEMVWNQEITTNYIYEGKVKVEADAYVPTGHTLTIKGPAYIEISRCDSAQGGRNAGLVELQVNGAFHAIGAFADSIYFRSDTTYDCDTLGVHPQPGDWYGIYVDVDAACSLSYCSITNAIYGIENRNNSLVTISNSNISDNSDDGIHNYKGILSVENSVINNNGLSGIWGNNSDNFIYGTRLIGNAKYGINLTGPRTGSTDSTLIQYNTLSSGGILSNYAVNQALSDRYAKRIAIIL